MSTVTLLKQIQDRIKTVEAAMASVVYADSLGAAVAVAGKFHLEPHIVANFQPLRYELHFLKSREMQLQEQMEKEKTYG